MFRHTAKELKAFWFVRLSLASVAALTPAHWDIDLIDENVESVDFDDPVDLVGITVMTPYANRAYDICREYQKRGVPCVLGGPHVTFLPEEGMKHATVVVGEAEGAWERLCADFEKTGQIDRLYRADRVVNMADIPVPRRDLFKSECYMTTHCVQTTRGCPFDCNYCSVTTFFGRGFRERPVEHVVREIEAMNTKFVAFVDDNIIANPTYAKKLFKALIPLNIKWGSQGSLHLARDPELLDLAQKSGCVAMFIGIESLSQANLKGAHKNFNKANRYEEELKIIHDHGIMINGSFIFGMDHDDEGVFERTVRFAERNHIETATFHILTPFPGTKLFHELEQAGRIIDYDWSHYNGGHVVYRPQLISAETLLNGYYWAYHEFYRLRNIFAGLKHVHPLFIPRRLKLNLGYRNAVKRLPKGSITPLGKAINRLYADISTREDVPLIPVPPDPEKPRIHLRDMLRVVPRLNENCSILVLDLEGILDTKTVSQLQKRISYALQHLTLPIALNFERISHFAPTALGKLAMFQPHADRIFFQNVALELQEYLPRWA